MTVLHLTTLIFKSGDFDIVFLIILAHGTIVSKDTIDVACFLIIAPIHKLLSELLANLFHLLFFLDLEGIMPKVWAQEVWFLANCRE